MVFHILNIKTLKLRHAQYHARCVCGGEESTLTKITVEFSEKINCFNLKIFTILILGFKIKSYLNVIKVPTY